MALTRKFLEGLGLDEKVVNAIIEGHGETVTALQGQIDKYKADAEKLPSVQKELDEAKAAAETGKKDSWKIKYDEKAKELDDFKAGIAKQESTEKKRTAYLELIKECKISTGKSGKLHDSILNLVDLDKVEIDDKGKIKSADEIKKTLVSEWADFVVIDGKGPAPTPTPPAGGGGDDIAKELVAMRKAIGLPEKQT